MEIINFQKVDLSTYKKSFDCNVYSIHVKINDVKGSADDMINIISDLSWIEKLGAVEKKTFKANSEKTVKKLVEDIFKKIDSKVTSDFGEYLISDMAGNALQKVHAHIKFPIAELWKSKVTGNDGFDFHTESHTNLICFGEAKYNSNSNPYSAALQQVNGFIKAKKDDSELLQLQPFCTSGCIDNYINNNRKAYILAFSLNTKNSKLVFKNLIKSIEIDELFTFPELYIIGIEI
ncbi:hypothetical protein OGH69_12775 [Flavobacterium sp. MFBS3-15]|uniref:hypothetical protein n=1 Tax=Flavobacterium sp. MFBS3-15 TaxID=2989816 RepID=UPI0022360406|nr:hypothetical protein [Flavobacterium sp. MFBS3-15]MCW4469846.1 hypothetical protein [Flavobacterium sp. MFBS3-15]